MHNTFTLIIIIVIILMLLVTIVLVGDFYTDKQLLFNIVSSNFDTALVQGQFTGVIKNQLVADLQNVGLAAGKYIITCSRSEFYDGSDSTFVGYGNTVTLELTTHAAHPLIEFLCKMVGGNPTGMRVRICGMSEKRV